MLDSDDLFVRDQAVLVFTAWADPPAINAAANLLQVNVHRRESLARHRLSGEDTVHDEIAEALEIGLGAADGQKLVPSNNCR